jgi:murein DD-endopeptidase MepM/ murein hydrolase activator NlpD
MTQNIYRAQKKSAKPSRIVALVALTIAFSLPYLLVKTFSHHHKSNYDYKPLSLPKIEQQNKIIVKKNIKDNTWQIISTRQGDTLSAVFSRLGLSAQNLHAVLKDNPHAKVLTTIKPLQQLQFLIKNNELEKLIVPFTSTQFLVIYKEQGSYHTKIDSKKMNSHDHYVTATIQGSLFGTAKRLNIPYKLIHQMTEILNWEIDFARDVRAGDRFTMIYKAFYIEDKLVGTGELTAVSYTNRGKTYQAIRHVNSAGDADYYTPQGNSLKKAFSRYPLKFSHFSSTFSLSRFHPILHYNRPHKGIDLAARIGTPILATGNGVIEIIGRQNAYGNMIKIKHDNQFSSIYGHMLKFQKGLSKGSKVKRGQVIGYVGQTGLASGPHCHYEFHIRNNPKNPTTVDLPKSAPIPMKEMASFKANTGTLLAHLKLFEEANVANVGKKSADVG